MKKFDDTQPVANIGISVMGIKVVWACARIGIPTRIFNVTEGKADESRQPSLTWGTEDNQESVPKNMMVCSSLEETLTGVL